MIKNGFHPRPPPKRIIKEDFQFKLAWLPSEIENAESDWGIGYNACLTDIKRARNRQLSRGKEFGVKIAWYDMWVGAYWDKKNRVLYICPLPCLVIKISF